MKQHKRFCNVDAICVQPVKLMRKALDSLALQKEVLLGLCQAQLQLLYAAFEAFCLYLQSKAYDASRLLQIEPVTINSSTFHTI